MGPTSAAAAPAMAWIASLVADVGGERVRLAAGGADRGDRRVQLFRVARDQDDLGAGARQLLGQRAAEPAAGAGHDGVAVTWFPPRPSA